MSMESAGPLSFNEGVVIKEITLQVDYASYKTIPRMALDEKASAGSRRCVKERENTKAGWTKVSRGGKSLATILPLMQAQSIPEEVS